MQFQETWSDGSPDGELKALTAMADLVANKRKRISVAKTPSAQNRRSRRDSEPETAAAAKDGQGKSNIILGDQSIQRSLG